MRTMMLIFCAFFMQLAVSTTATYAAETNNEPCVFYSRSDYNSNKYRCQREGEYRYNQINWMPYSFKLKDGYKLVCIYKSKQGQQKEYTYTSSVRDFRSKIRNYGFKDANEFKRYFVKFKLIKLGQGSNGGNGNYGNNGNNNSGNGNYGGKVCCHERDNDGGKKKYLDMGTHYCNDWNFEPKGSWYIPSGVCVTVHYKNRQNQNRQHTFRDRVPSFRAKAQQWGVDYNQLRRHIKKIVVHRCNDNGNGGNYGNNNNGNNNNGGNYGNGNGGNNQGKVCCHERDNDGGKKKYLDMGTHYCNNWDFEPKGSWSIPSGVCVTVHYKNRQNQNRQHTFRDRVPSFRAKAQQWGVDYNQLRRHIKKIVVHRCNDNGNGGNYGNNNNGNNNNGGNYGNSGNNQGKVCCHERDNDGGKKKYLDMGTHYCNDWNFEPKGSWYIPSGVCVTVHYKNRQNQNRQHTFRDRVPSFRAKAQQWGVDYNQLRRHIKKIVVHRCNGNGNGGNYGNNNNGNNNNGGNYGNGNGGNNAGKVCCHERDNDGGKKKYLDMGTHYCNNWDFEPKGSWSIPSGVCVTVHYKNRQNQNRQHTFRDRVPSFRAKAQQWGVDYNQLRRHIKKIEVHRCNGNGNGGNYGNNNNGNNNNGGNYGNGNGNNNNNNDWERYYRDGYLCFGYGNGKADYLRKGSHNISQLKWGYPPKRVKIPTRYSLYVHYKTNSGQRRYKKYKGEYNDFERKMQSDGYKANRVYKIELR